MVHAVYSSASIFLGHPVSNGAVISATRPTLTLDAPLKCISSVYLEPGEHHRAQSGPFDTIDVSIKSRTPAVDQFINSHLGNANALAARGSRSIFPRSRNLISLYIYNRLDKITARPDGRRCKLVFKVGRSESCGCQIDRITPVIGK